MKPDDRVELTWVMGGATRKARVVKHSLVVEIDGDEYEYERGQDGYWYEINESQDPISIEKIVQNVVIGECVLCGGNLICEGEHMKCLGCSYKVKNL